MVVLLTFLCLLQELNLSFFVLDQCSGYLQYIVHVTSYDASELTFSIYNKQVANIICKLTAVILSILDHMDLLASAVEVTTL